jgi:4-hydroxybenzoate polyprenyltransferase
MLIRLGFYAESEGRRMFKALSDYMIFVGIVFFICAVISFVIMKVRTDKIVKTDENLKDLTTFYKNKWCNKNFWVVGIIIVCYFIIAGVSAVLHWIPVLILASIALIIAYIIINIKMMNYVEEKVQNKK